MSFPAQFKRSGWRNVVGTKMQLGEFINVWYAPQGADKGLQWEFPLPYQLYQQQMRLGGIIWWQVAADTMLLPLSHSVYTVPPAWNIQPKLFPWPTPTHKYYIFQKVQICQAPFLCASVFPFSCAVCPRKLFEGGDHAYHVPAVSPGWAQCPAHSGWTEFSYNVKLEMVVYWIIKHRSKIP